MSDVSLRDYFEAMLDEREKAIEAALAAQEKAVTAALDASDKAISKAESNAEKWRQNANEWRGAMSDRDRELPSRREVDAALDTASAAVTGIGERTNLLERQVARAYGVAAGAIALAGIAVAIVLAGA